MIAIITIAVIALIGSVRLKETQRKLRPVRVFVGRR